MTHRKKNIGISFIIPVLDGEKDIGQCLDHIIKEMAGNDEIIVVDNGSADNTIKIVERYEKAKVLSFPEATIAGLRNRGARIARGDTLAFIDADCLVCGGWRQAVASVMNDKNIKVTGSICDIPSSATWIEKAWWSLRSSVRMKVNYIASANFIIDRGVFNEVSGFDEDLTTDEDSEICVRVIKSGHSIIDDPAIRTIHLGNPKTLLEFIKKEKWHATSIISTMSSQKVDKPMVMTFGFMICWLVSLALIPLRIYHHFNPIYIVLPVFIVPVLTACYRIYQYNNAKYFLHLIILYFVFYMARSLTIIEHLFNVNKS